MAFQTATAEFDGTQDYVDITWPVQYERFKLFATAYGAGAIPLVALENATPEGVRVTPSVPFTGKVDVEIIELNELADPPLVLALDPDSGPSETAVTITGFFLLGATRVRFGNFDAEFSVVDDQTIEAIVPENAITAAVFVTTPAGEAEGPVFTVEATPTDELELFSFRRTISQPADGSDFFASFPEEQPNDDYAAHASVISGGAGVLFMLPNETAGDRTTTQMRVKTSGDLPDGAEIEIIVTKPGA